MTPDTGLSASPGRLLGGVSKFPTLAIVAGACDGCDVLIVLKDGYLCIPDSGGGGSSKVPRFDALGLLAVKLGGAPSGSCPGCIWVG